MSDQSLPEDELPEISLAELSEDMKQACARAGWSQLLPVQARALPYLLSGRDVMIQSRTGSGKTGAFLLPILERIDRQLAECQALVLVPTRELAKQVAAEANLLAGGHGMRVVEVYGGVGYRNQMDGFKAGAHLVVGTPGRILDHLVKNTLSLARLKMLVFDEADRMLSMGFLPDMWELRRYLPDHEIDSFMFSATYPAYVLGLARQFLRSPRTLNLSQDNVHVTEIEHVFYEVPPMQRDRSLVRIIEMLNPASAIIFCNTKSNVHYVNVVLQRFGYDADELSSDLGQTARENVLARVRKGTLRFLVATDVAARGIDITGLSHVIQYEPPEDPESYIHRAGRTGRVGASGEAITLVAGMEKSGLLRIGRRFNIDFQERKTPEDTDVQAVVAERLTALLESRLRKRDSLQVERMQRFLPLARELAECTDELSLIAMLLDDSYQASLHAPALPAELVESVSPESKGARKRRNSRGSKSRRPRKRR